MYQTLLHLLYPARCPVCFEIVQPKGHLICNMCKNKVQYIKEPRCKKCSKPVEQEEQEYCTDCSQRVYHFVQGYSLWVYDDIMKQSIAAFKYRNKREYANYYLTELLAHYGMQVKRLAPDAIVPIPIHWSKHMERGYNQADILAKGIGRALDIPVLSHLLIRDKRTLPQKKLTDKERLQNLREAFHYNKVVEKKSKCHLRRILLIDDIYTTGSTIEACSHMLINQGIEEIYFITLCIGKGF